MCREPPVGLGVYFCKIGLLGVSAMCVSGKGSDSVPAGCDFVQLDEVRSTAERVTASSDSSFGISPSAKGQTIQRE